MEQNCTLWFRERTDDQGKKSFGFNHLEDGVCLADKPTPMHPNHKVWVSANWKKEHALLKNGVIIHSTTTSEESC